MAIPTTLAMPMKMPPKGVLFDLGDTLLREGDYQPLIGITQLFERARLRAEADLETARAASIALLTEIRGMRDSGITEFPFQSWLRLIVDRFCVERDVSLAEAELEFWKVSAQMEPQPGIAAVLARLAARKIPCGVVSNAMFSARLLAWELARHGFGEAFQFVMSSADYGVQKPHPAIFQAAAARLGLEPAEIWFVGDSYRKDVQGARNAGMTGIWYNPRQAASQDESTVQISDWAEFPKLAG
jgi:HAD superfamily hydrolase (TIGR01509 family)